MYYIYILQCEDDSLYSGITTDVERRFAEHKGGRGVGAKYTRSRKPKSIKAIWSAPNRSDASKLEAAIKKLKRVKKEELILSPSDLSRFFSDKLDFKLYTNEHMLLKKQTEYESDSIE